MIPYLRHVKLLFILCLITWVQCFCVSGQNQKHRIQGKIINAANNKPIEDVMISIKGTAIGTRSKHEGNFSLIDSFPAMDSTTQILFTDVCFLHMAYKEKRSIKFGTSTITNSDSLFRINLVPDTTYINSPIRKPKNSTTVENRGIKQANYPVPPKRSDHAEGHIIIDGAEYPGGFQHLLSDVKKLTTKAANERGIKGNALIVFEVNQHGKTTCINALQSTNDKVRQEALKIVQNLNGWKPAYQSGKPVPVKYSLSIEFE